MNRIGLAFFLLLVGCGGTATSTSSGSTTPVGRGALVGTVVYEARTPTFSGVSVEVTERPARFVRVRALDANGRTLGETSTNADGTFELPGAATATRVSIAARIEADGYDLAVTRDPMGREPHEFSAPVGVGPLRVVASDATADGPGGALHLLDTLLRGEMAVREWLGATLPPLYAYWGRGVTSEWSWYEGEQPAGSGRYKLELLGGERGQRATTDTDEHDEAVVLHELGHFVFDRLSSASSAGGQHPSGHFVDPGLAWEEGRATWFAAIVLGTGLYTDSIGMAPSGRLQAHTDLERRNPPPRGLGSQESVEEVLWDLVDGSERLPTDHDRDGAAVDPVVLLRTMIALGREPNAFPCFPTFLRYIVDQGVVPEAQVRAVLANGSLPVALLPENGQSPWPLELPVGDAGRSGRIDSIADPSPSGGPRLPHTGYDAIHTYRLIVTEPSTLTLDLAIDAAGDETDRSDLDLELRDLRSDEVASSRGTTRTEQIVRPIEPGHYIVRVVDGGRDGARARYVLRARLTRR